MKNTYLYVVTNGDSKYKIGISNNPRKRLSSLNTSSTHKLEICLTVLCKDNTDALIKEKQIHELMGRKRRINGEWFNLDKFELRALLSFISDSLLETIYGFKLIGLKKEELKELKKISVVKKDDNEIIEIAKNLILEEGRGSSSFLQRKLCIGYARAARILDQLERDGIVGPHAGSKARKVIYPKAKTSLITEVI